MTDPTPSHNALAELVARLQALEEANARMAAQNQWLKRFIFGVALFATVWTIGSYQASRASLANEPSCPSVLEAQEFLLRDAQGRKRASLHITPEGTALDISDSSERKRASLHTTAEGTSLAISDESGHLRATFGNYEKGPQLSLRDEAGKARLNMRYGKSGPEVLLFDESGRLRVALNVTREGPNFRLLDEFGRRILRPPGLEPRP